ncbi:MAG: efflux RND transporter permease subunit, partial [Lentihominibacter sp.]
MLSKFSVKRPFTVLVAVVIVIVFGVISFMKMTPDLFPNINTPYVMVMTAYPGASPEEAETEITEPMEQQMATLTNIKNVTSVSAANYSMIQMEFSDDVNMDAISVDIRDKISQIEGNMPETAGTPVVMKINPDMIPIVTSAVGMKGKSAGEVSQFTKENLENQLSGVEGVASVSAMGMISDNIQIVLSQKKIDEINDKISSAISSQLGEAKEQINSGISAANSGKEQIASGKTAVIEGQKQASQQIAATRSQLKSGREKLVELKKQGPTLKALLKQYDEAIASNNPVAIKAAEQAIALLGMDVDTLRKSVEQLDTIDQQIAAVDTALRDLDAQGATATFTLGNKYSDLSAAESTIDATVNQLQSALAELQSSEDAALASADMTGVLTMNNIS